MKKLCFRSILAGILGLLFLSGRLVPLQARAAPLPQVTYTLQVADPASHIMHVILEVQGWTGGPASFSLMTSQDLTFTVSLYCSRETMTFPWHYANLRAIAEDGTELPLHLISQGLGSRGEAVVRVNPQGYASFRLAYDVIPLGGKSFGMLPDETHERLASYLGEKFGVFFERHVLFLPNDFPRNTPVHFRFQLPPQWIAVTPWAEKEGGYGTNLQTLRNPSWYWGGGIAVGPFELRQEQIGHTVVRTAVSSSIPERDREMAFRVAFESFRFISKVYGDFPAPYFLAVIYDEPSEKTCEGGRHEGYPIMDLLRGDATAFTDYQAILGISEPPGSPPGWQAIPDEMSYLWMEMTAEGRRLDCWVMSQGNPTLYTYAAYQAGAWDVDWRNPAYHFVNPKVWYYSHRLDYLMNWEKDHWVFIDERGMTLDYEIQRRTLGYFHLWDIVGRIYREHTNPCDYNNFLATAKKVTGQDFSDWFERYVYSPNASENLAHDYYVDTDKDGVWDWIEEDLGLDPYDKDTDGDGLSDGQEMLPWGMDNLTFTDPLSAESPGGHGAATAALPPRPSADTQPANAEAPASMVMDLSTAQITLDGKVEDWPQLKPRRKDPVEPSLPADITAFYLFKDSRYLYLRLDGHFPLDTYEQITFDLHVRFSSGKSKLFQMSTETTEAEIVHLIPDQGAGHLLFDQQVMYRGAALSAQHYEAIVPLDALGGDPEDIRIHVYIVDETHLIEDLPRVEQSWLVPTATPKPSPTPVPTSTPPSVIASPSPSVSSASPTSTPSASSATPWASGVFLPLILWTSGALLAGGVVGYLSVVLGRQSHG